MLVDAATTQQLSAFRRRSLTSLPADLIQSALALSLLVVCLPLFLGASLFILWRAGRPIFYRGLRVGLNGQTFNILKFRTLHEKAQIELGPRLLSQVDEKEKELVIPGGRFLRETRLDEFPQFLNVFLGHMSFIGPRPERPEVVAENCHIPGYNERFKVKPGLIGFSQLFTPHSTEKRYRTLVDNQIAGRRAGSLHLHLLIITAFHLLLTTTMRTCFGVLDAVRCKLRGCAGRRQNHRHQLRNASIRALLPAGPAFVGRVPNINARHLLAVSPMKMELPARPFPLVLTLGLRHGRVRKASFEGRAILPTRAMGSEHGYVIEIRPVCSRKTMTNKSRYVLDQYFLRRSVAWLRFWWANG